MVATSMIREEVERFFETYRDAFNRLDGDAVADLWHVASGITDSPAGAAGAAGPETARLTWWPDDAPMRANHRALCDVYRRSAYGSADFVLKAHVSMGPNHAFAHVHWTLWRSDGGLLQQFHTGYQLLRIAGAVRVLLAVAHQEDISSMNAGQDAGPEAGSEAGPAVGQAKGRGKGQDKRQGKSGDNGQDTPCG